MVVLLLFLILLVIAWPLFAIFGGTLFVMLGSHLHIIIPTVLIAVVYLAILAPIAKRNNIKLGGKYGEAIDPTKPIGHDYRELTRRAVERALDPNCPVADDDHKLVEALGPSKPIEPAIGQMSQGGGVVPDVKISLLNPDQWKSLPPGLVADPRQGPKSVKTKRNTNRRAITVAAVAFVLCAPLTVIVLDAVSRNALAQGSPLMIPTATLDQDDGSTGRWQVTRSVDPMSDAESVRFTMLADRAAGRTPISLMVECSARQTSVGIHWNEYLGAEEAGPYFVKDVSIRLGSERPETRGWVSSPDQTATWAGHPTTQLVMGIMQNAKVAAQVTPYNSSPLAVSFETSGLQELIEGNAGACGLVNTSTAKPNNTRLIVNQTLTGWVRWDGEKGSINGQGTWAHFTISTPGRDILFAGCEIKTTVSVPCKVTFGSHGEQIVNFISAGAY